MKRAQSSWTLGILAGLLIAAAVWFGLTQWPGPQTGLTVTANVTTNAPALESTRLDRVTCLKEAFKAPSCYLPQPDRPGNGQFNENGTFILQNQTYPCHCNTPENDLQNLTEATTWPDENEPHPTLEEWPDLDRIQTTVVATPLPERQRRSDGAVRVSYGPGSDQNPAFWDPNTLVFTRFSQGYNQGPAVLMGVYLNNKTEFVIWQDESQNVNVNGNPFTPDRKQICYASDVEDGDEIWCLDLATKNRTRITRHAGGIHFIEPSVSKNGNEIAFEMHPDSSSDNPGQIWTTDLSGNAKAVTADDADNRLPQFNPSDERLLFQRRIGNPKENPFKLVILHTNASIETLPLPTAGGTDASWTSANEIAYSSEDERLLHPKIFTYDLKPQSGRQETFEPTVEDGAPAASPDGKWLAFESHLTEDEKSPTRIWLIQRR